MYFFTHQSRQLCSTVNACHIFYTPNQGDQLLFTTNAGTGIPELLQAWLFCMLKNRVMQRLPYQRPPSPITQDYKTPLTYL